MLNCVKEVRILYNRISKIHIMEAVATIKIFVLLALLSFIQPGLTAPNKPNRLEHAYLDKLNKPWFTPDIPSEFPRKGEGLCKGGRCKVNCDDCQVHVPLDGPGSTKPATIPRSQLKYLHFVVQGATNRQKYTYWTAKNIAKDPRIDFKRMTLVVAIGYLDSTNFPISMILTSEYIRRGYNVILIDNQRFATVHYFLATRLMRPVGKHVAEILAILTRSGLDPTKLELLGFSLGGQTVSYIAKNFQLLTGRNISRITALEPAGPCFRDLGPTERLGSTNADFVQVIHTNIDGYGMANRMGHVDFYVNGGEYQPADLNLFPCTATCSHFRVLALWAIAVRNPEKFIAIKCNTIQEARDAECYKNKLVTNVMGLDVDVKKHGIFFLSTSKSYPFYLGKAGIKKEFAAWRRISDINDSNETDIYT